MLAYNSALVHQKGSPSELRQELVSSDPLQKPQYVLEEGCCADAEFP